MAAPVGSIYTNMILDAGNYIRGLQQAERQTAASMSGIQRSAGLTTRSVGQFQRSMGQQIRPYSLIAVSRAFDNTADRANLLRGALIATTGVFGGFAAALTSNIVLRYADSFTQLTNQLRSVSGSTEEASAKFKALDDVATRSRSGIKETVILFSRLSKAAPNFDQQKILNYVETIQKALQLGGATAQEAASAAVQFSQAIASNRLGGDELRAVLETPLGLALAKGLGVTIGKLRELGTTGKLTREQLFNALGKIGPDINAQFENSVQTLDQAITLADNRFTAYFGSVNQTYGVTKLLGGAVLGLSDNLDTIGGVLKYLVPLFGGLFAGKILKSVIGGVSNTLGQAIRDIHNVEAAAEKASNGIGGAWTHLREKTEGELTKARDSIKQYQTDITQAQAKLSELNAPTATPRQFADTASVKQLQRDTEALKKADQEHLAVQQKVREAYQKLGTVNAQVTPKILSATKSVAEAESKLATLVEKRTKLQAQGQIAASNKELSQTVAGLQPQNKASQALAREAAAEQIRIQKQIAAAEQEVAAARTRLSERFIGLTKAEAAAAQLAAEQRIAALRAVDAATLQSIVIEEERAALQSKVNASVTAVRSSGSVNRAAEITAQEEAITRYTAGLAAANLAQRTASASATLMARSIAFAGAGFRSLFAFLGGPWGVALIGATVAFSLFAEKSAKAAEDASRAQDELAKRLGKLSEASDKAGKSLASLNRRAKLGSLTQEAEDYTGQIALARKELEALAGNSDLQKSRSPRAGQSTQFRSFVKSEIDLLVKDGTKVDQIVRDIQSRGRLLGATDQDIAAMTDLVKLISEYSVGLKGAKEESVALSDTSKFTDAYTALNESRRAESKAMAAARAGIIDQRIEKIMGPSEKIAQEIASAMRSNGEIINDAVMNFIRQSVRSLAVLDKLDAAANRPVPERLQPQGNIRYPGQGGPNQRSALDPFFGAQRGEIIERMNEFKKKILENQQLLRDSQKILDEGVTGDVIKKLFGSSPDYEKIKSQIESLNEAYKRMKDQFLSGKVGPGEVSGFLDIFQSILSKAPGATPEIVDGILKPLREALTQQDKLRGEILNNQEELRRLEQKGYSVLPPGGGKIIIPPRSGEPPSVWNPDNGAPPYRDLPSIPQPAPPSQQPPAVPVPQPAPPRTLPPAIPAPPPAPSPGQPFKQPGAPEPGPKPPSALQNGLLKLKQEILDTYNQVQQLPDSKLTDKIVGDPAKLDAAKEQFKDGLDQIMSDMRAGQTTTEELGGRVDALVQSFSDITGTSSDSLAPFRDEVAATLVRIQQLLIQLRNVEAAIARIKGAKQKINYNPSTDGSPSGSGNGGNQPLAFASGGAFRVGGAGGIDSQHVHFRASPNETVAVFTPSQLRALGGITKAAPAGNGDVTVHANITVNTNGAEISALAKRQIQMDLANTVQAATNRTR